MIANKNIKILVLGASGMVGSSIKRRLLSRGYNKILFPNKKELDLRNKKDVQSYLENNKPDMIFLAAAKVGGIHANDKYKTDFLYENLEIQNNVIYSAYTLEIKKLIFLGSSCIYPKNAPQPIKENFLLSGPLESTNEYYALAKITGIKLCESISSNYDYNYVSVMPCNLYGPNDNYHDVDSHVIPALIKKIVKAKKNNSKQITLWGSGSPLREFMHVDDLSDACIFLYENEYNGGLINIGSGNEISISELSELILNIVNYKCKINFDTTMPDGTPRKIMDLTKINSLGWNSQMDFKEGLTKIINEFNSGYGRNI